MSQAYGDDFARLYDSRWATFAVEAAPVIHAFHTSRSGSDLPLRMLDLCCGTGQLTRYFLDRGFRATGVDLSEAMLGHARRNAGPHLQDGAADFVRADAADFELSQTYGLVVSTYDALNHLPHLEALRSCLACVAAVTVPGGQFVFDLVDVARLAEQTGWELYFAVLEDLTAPLAEPELEGRVFAVATRVPAT